MDWFTLSLNHFFYIWSAMLLESKINLAQCRNWFSIPIDFQFQELTFNYCLILMNWFLIFDESICYLIMDIQLFFDFNELIFCSQWINVVLVNWFSVYFIGIFKIFFLSQNLIKNAISVLIDKTNWNPIQLSNLNHLVNCSSIWCKQVRN